MNITMIQYSCRDCPILVMGCDFWHLSSHIEYYLFCFAFYLWQKLFSHFCWESFLTFQIIRLTFADTFLMRAKVFFLYVIMLFQKSQWYFLLNSLLHNNSHFISLDYFENSLRLHYFSFVYVGVKPGILRTKYLKKCWGFSMANVYTKKKLKHWLDLLPKASMNGFISNPENSLFVHPSDTGIWEQTNKLYPSSGRHSYQCCSSTLFSPLITG